MIDIFLSHSKVFGLHYGHVMQHISGHHDRLMHWTPFALVLFCTGFIIHFSGMPMNTDLYSLSFLFVSGGASVLLAIAFYVLVDIYCRARVLWTPFMHVGMNAITVYLLAEADLVKWPLSTFYWSEGTWSLSNILWPTGELWGDPDYPLPSAPHHNYAVLLWTFGYVAVWMLIARIMFNRKIFIII